MDFSLDFAAIWPELFIAVAGMILTPMRGEELRHQVRDRAKGLMGGELGRHEVTARA